MRYETLDYIVAVAVAFFLISCGGKNRDADNHGQMFDKPVSDTLRVNPEDSDTAVVPVPADSVLEYMENSNQPRSIGPVFYRSLRVRFQNMRRS